MKRTLQFFLTAIVALTAMPIQRAAAQLPDSVQQFRFIPSRSTLSVTRAADNLRKQFFAYGKFGVNTGYGNGPHAEFVNLESWLVPDSSLTFVWHTDGMLNLSGLQGSFVPSNPSLLHFQGVDAQGAPFQLIAEQQGKLVRLVGETYPSSPNLFKYKLDAMAYIAPYADFNLDGLVDEVDASTVTQNIGLYAHATFEQGDADGDGDVDGSDFLAWQREIGAATLMSAFVSGSSSGILLGSAVVPEPATVILLSIAAWMCSCLGARRKRRG